MVWIIKEFFQKHLEKGVDTEAKIVPTRGVCDFLPSPLLQKLIVHHGTYRDRGRFLNPVHAKGLVSFAGNSVLVMNT